MPSKNVYEKVKCPQILTLGRAYLLLCVIILCIFILVEVVTDEKIIYTESSSDTPDKAQSLL